jgi:hypothetical protein
MGNSPSTGKTYVADKHRQHVAACKALFREAIPVDDTYTELEKDILEIKESAIAYVQRFENAGPIDKPTLPPLLEQQVAVAVPPVDQTAVPPVVSTQAGGSSNYKSNRRDKYNVFKMINELEKTHMTGGNEPEYEDISTSNDSAMLQIKDAIMSRINSLEKNKTGQVGGCNCNDQKNKIGGNIDFEIENSISSSSTSTSLSTSSSSTTSTSEYNKKKNKKTHHITKDSTSINSDSSDILVVNETPVSSEISRNKRRKSKKSKKSKKVTTKYHSDRSDDEEAGLSIFPFNSSDIRSSESSFKNIKMLRRKI